MDAQQETTKNQMVQLIQHYGMETMVALFSHALIEVSDNLAAVGAAPDVVASHKTLGVILANHVAD